jgi:hypothetical protein
MKLNVNEHNWIWLGQGDVKFSWVKLLFDSELNVGEKT